MRSTGKAQKGEECSNCGKAFTEGERITEYWQWGELHSIMCRNSVACEKQMTDVAGLQDGSNHGKGEINV